MCRQFVVFAVWAVLAGCAAGDSERPIASRPDASVSDDASAGTGGAAGNVPIILFDGALSDAPSTSDVVTTLTISPAAPVIDVTVVDGKVTAIATPDDAGSPLVFRATANGDTPVTASWSIDRGELGTLVVATGEFTPNGLHSGVATVTASHAGATAATTLTVRVHATSNGPPAGYDPSTGGVGGEGLHDAVDVATVTALRGPATAPASTSELGWLYPYDGTVWPRGTLAPLLQWQTTHPVSAVYVHVKQDNFEFEGFYGGVMLIRQPIEPTAWATALNGNGGDKLHVELRVLSGSTVYGPIAQDWTVAPGPLRGTVYYNSYDTAFAKPQQVRAGAAVLAIKPGASAPVLAIPGSEDKCIVCHTVSDDGSTIFAQYANPNLNYDYADGISYDLRQGTQIASYTGSAPDGTSNDRKFLWSAPSRDGTYALASVGVQEQHFSGKPGVYRRDNGNAVPTTGLEIFNFLVTPSFSRDGKRLALDYWYLNNQSPLPNGDGHTIDVMDVSCTPSTDSDGGPSCSSVDFKNPKRLYDTRSTTSDFVGWPAWLPDGTGIVFHHAVKNPQSTSDTTLSTWKQAQAQIWFVEAPSDGSTPVAIPLSALNGIDDQGNSILPKAPGVSLHDSDHRMNYEPTVNPVVSGGYNWVVFTSRRAYGNTLTNDPFEDQYKGPAPYTKKLWVAAVDLKRTPGKDPSHPPFYLPGQELLGANMRGFWAVDPCRADGQSCESGDECCGGYCRPSEDGGALVCGQKPTGCAQEYEKCEVSSDCCGFNVGYECINGFCAQPQPAPPR